MAHIPQPRHNYSGHQRTRRGSSVQESPQPRLLGHVQHALGEGRDQYHSRTKEGGKEIEAHGGHYDWGFSKEFQPVKSGLEADITRLSSLEAHADKKQGQDNRPKGNRVDPIDDREPGPADTEEQSGYHRPDYGRYLPD